MLRIIFALVVVAMLTWAVPSVLAAEMADESSGQRSDQVYVSRSGTKGPFYHINETEKRVRKLCRGVANVTLCAAEVPVQMFRESYRSSPITGSITGAGKGVVKGAQRLVVGCWEIVTFYHPMKNDYAPYIEPEIVGMSTHP